MTKADPMSIEPGEPVTQIWEAVTVADLVADIRSATGAVRGRPAVVAVDGRGGAGKSTVAQQLHAAVPNSAIVHTDDVAWNQSFFDWQDLLIQHVLQPARGGRPVSYQPQAWREHGRAGEIAVPTGLDWILLEGSGSGRRELSHLVDAVLWVQSDSVEAKRRALQRDVTEGAKSDAAEAAAFWDEWMTQEIPFFAEQRPWERACSVVAGTAVLDHSPDQVVVAARPFPSGTGPCPTFTDPPARAACGA